MSPILTHIFSRSVDKKKNEDKQERRKGNRKSKEVIHPKTRSCYDGNSPQTLIPTTRPYYSPLVPPALQSLYNQLHMAITDTQ
jgi:hypothetical protein